MILTKCINLAALSANESWSLLCLLVCFIECSFINNFITAFCVSVWSFFSAILKTIKNTEHEESSAQIPQSKLTAPCFVAIHYFGHRNDTKLMCVLAFEKLYLLVSQICIQFRKMHATCALSVHICFEIMSIELNTLRRYASVPYLWAVASLQRGCSEEKGLFVCLQLANNEFWMYLRGILYKAG